MQDKAEQVKLHIRDGQKHAYSMFLVPRESTLVKRILEEEGVLGEVTISSFNMQFIPLSDDVVSLENENAFKEIWAVSSGVFAAVVQVLIQSRMETSRSYMTLLRH